MDRFRLRRAGVLLFLFYLLAGVASAQAVSDPIDSISSVNNWSAGSFSDPCFISAFNDSSCISYQDDNTDPLTPVYLPELTLANETNAELRFIAGTDYASPNEIGVTVNVDGESQVRQSVSMEGLDTYNLTADLTRFNSTHYEFRVTDFEDGEISPGVIMPYDGDDNFTVGMRFDSSCNFCTHKWAIHSLDSSGVFYAGADLSGETLEDFQALNLIDPPDSTNFVAGDTGTVDVDFLFEWITDQQGVDDTDFGLIWRLKNSTSGNIVVEKNYDLGTGPSAGDKEETVLLQPGSYEWELEGTSSENPSSFSEIFYFDILTQASSPYKITLISPADGAEVANAGTGDTTEVEMEFQIDADGPGTWRVQSGQYATPLVSGSISQGIKTYTTSYDFDNDNEYTWHVEAINQSSGAVYSSEQFAFTLGDVADGGGPQPGADTDNLIGLIVSGLSDFFGLIFNSIDAELGVGGTSIVAIFLSVLFAVVVSYVSEVLGVLTFLASMVGFGLLEWLPGWATFTMSMIAVAIALWLVNKVANGGD